MAIQCGKESVSRHKDWPLTLERMHQYLQALNLPVDQQSHLLSAVLCDLENREIDRAELCTLALRVLRQTLTHEHQRFANQVVADRYGFDQQRNLEQRHWSMPAMKRSSMQPSRRPDPKMGRWSDDRTKSRLA